MVAESWFLQLPSCCTFLVVVLCGEEVISGAGHDGVVLRKRVHVSNIHAALYFQRFGRHRCGPFYSSWGDWGAGLSVFCPRPVRLCWCFDVVVASQGMPCGVCMCAAPGPKANVASSLYCVDVYAVYVGMERCYPLWLFAILHATCAA